MITFDIHSHNKFKVQETLMFIAHILQSESLDYEIVGCRKKLDF